MAAQLAGGVGRVRRGVRQPPGAGARTAAEGETLLRRGRPETPRTPSTERWPARRTSGPRPRSPAPVLAGVLALERSDWTTPGAGPPGTGTLRAAAPDATGLPRLGAGRRALREGHRGGGGPDFPPASPSAACSPDLVRSPTGLRARLRRHRAGPARRRWPGSRGAEEAAADGRPAGGRRIAARACPRGAPGRAGGRGPLARGVVRVLSAVGAVPTPRQEADLDRRRAAARRRARTPWPPGRGPTGRGRAVALALPGRPAGRGRCTAPTT